MGLARPYKRTVRQLKDGSYSSSGNSGYLKHPDYASSPEKYIRNFLLIQNDIQKLFEYIEPSDKNKRAYSYRIYELYIRVCIEVEANCKAILRENNYVKKGNWAMPDYRLIEKTHKLSEYEVLLPRWEGNRFNHFTPFKNWANDGALQWYALHHEVKHDIHSNFSEHANIKNLIEATSGLIVLLSAQFLAEDFSPGPGFLAWEGDGLKDGMESAIGEYFRVKYPTWNVSDRYDFTWAEIKDSSDVIKCHDYSSLATK